MRVTILAAIAALATACGSGPVSRELGASCTLDSQCDQRCLMGNDYPGGFCTIACDTNSTCPGGALCSADEGGACLFACQVNQDCDFLGPGWTCQSRDGKPGGKVLVCRG